MICVVAYFIAFVLGGIANWGLQTCSGYRNSILIHLFCVLILFIALPTPHMIALTVSHCSKYVYWSLFILSQYAKRALMVCFSEIVSVDDQVIAWASVVIRCRTLSVLISSTEYGSTTLSQIQCL